MRFLRFMRGMRGVFVARIEKETNSPSQSHPILWGLPRRRRGEAIDHGERTNLWNKGHFFLFFRGTNEALDRGFLSVDRGLEIVECRRMNEVSKVSDVPKVCDGPFVPRNKSERIVLEISPHGIKRKT